MASRGISDIIIFVGKFSSRVRESDIEKKFGKFGKIVDIEMR